MFTKKARLYIAGIRRCAAQMDVRAVVSVPLEHLVVNGAGSICTSCASAAAQTVNSRTELSFINPKQALYFHAQRTALRISVRGWSSRCYGRNCSALARIEAGSSDRARLVRTRGAR